MAGDMTTRARFTAAGRAWLDKLTLGRLALLLACVAAGSAVLNATSRTLANWTPNVTTEALSLLLTIVVVDRIVERRTHERARDRVAQALARVRGDFRVLTDFVLWDYADMHDASYERPPNALPELLAHFKHGLETRDQPWSPDPLILTATKALAAHLEEQLSRHERVLDDSFVAEGYRFIRSERMGRNMYLDDRDHHDENARKTTALASLADGIVRLYNAYLAYAHPYLDSANVTLRDEEIECAALIRDRGEHPERN